MEIFDLREFDAHEQVVFGHDAATGMRAIIAIHSTTLGPAAGGCRLWPYATTAEAVADVLRLSRGMSYKNAMAGPQFGGGKAVIIADAEQVQDPGAVRGLRPLRRFPGRPLCHRRGRRHDHRRHGQVARATRYVAGLAAVHRGRRAAIRDRRPRSGCTSGSRRR